jgi:HAD superfamily hydrolase (TIGR01509 family)
VVLFDLGDTIIQFGDIDHAALFERAARRTYELWSGHQNRMPGFRRYYLHQWFAMHWGYFKQRVLRREMSAMRYIRRACRKLWLEAEDDFYKELAWRWYQPLAEQATLEPGTHETLSALRSEGYTLALVSNTFVPGFVLDRHLRALNLLDHFPVRVYSCDVGFRKPDPRIFQIALERVGAQPGECVFVGDNVAADVMGARQAGMFPIWKRTIMNRDMTLDTVAIDASTIDSLCELAEADGVLSRVEAWSQGRKLAV